MAFVVPEFTQLMQDINDFYDGRDSSNVRDTEEGNLIMPAFLEEIPGSPRHYVYIDPNNPDENFHQLDSTLTLDQQRALAALITQHLNSAAVQGIYMRWQEGRGGKRYKKSRGTRKTLRKRKNKRRKRTNKNNKRRR
jgi:hypothetical protein